MSMKYKVRTNPEINVHKYLAFLNSYCQRKNDDIHKYFELFKLIADGIKNFGGNLGRDLYVCGIMEKKQIIHVSSTPQEFADAYKKLSKDDHAEILNAAESKSLAVAFLMGGKPDQYGELILTLQNQYLLKNDLFPNNLTEAYNLMANFLINPNLSNEFAPNAQNFKNSVYSLGLSFLQKTDIATPDDDSTKGIECDTSFLVSVSSSDTADTIGFCFTRLSSYRYKDLDNKYTSIKST